MELYGKRKFKESNLSVEETTIKCELFCLSRKKYRKIMCGLRVEKFMRWLLKIKYC